VDIDARIAMATVEEIRRDVLPRGTRILAGQRPLGAEVARVVALRSRPPGLPELHGGELILISMKNLRLLDPDLSLSRVIESVASAAAAVAIAGPIEEGAVEAARRAAVPLLELPAVTEMKGLEHEIGRHILEMRTEWYAFRHSVLHDLTQLAATGQGLEAIARRMADLTDCAVVIRAPSAPAPIVVVPARVVDWDMLSLDSFAAGDHLIPEWNRTHAVTSVSGHPARARSTEKHRLTRTVGLPAHGDVSIVGTSEMLTKKCDVVLEAGLSAVTIELSRLEAAESAARRLGGDLLSELIRSELVSGALGNRALRSGYDLRATWIAVSVQPSPIAGASRDPVETQSGLALDSLRSHLERRLKEIAHQGVIHDEDDCLTIFCRLATADEMGGARRSALDLCLEAIRSSRFGSLAAGVSRGHSGSSAFHAAFHESTEALRLGRQLQPNHAVTHFSELGVHRLLLGLNKQQQLREYHDEMLEAIEAYDRARNSWLIETLGEWLDGPSINEVAKRMNLHRNTLSYRLRRIAEISGHDLEDPETRFALRLALRIRQVLAASPETRLGS
jgi:sugar diacid utilization regulator